MELMAYCGIQASGNGFNTGAIMAGPNVSVIITTINNPSKAVQLFSAIEGVNLIVVGDKRTPSNWFTPGAMFLSSETQEKLEFGISRFLPFNHYSRKNIGYLHAMTGGAEIIVDTDDDNLPKHDWGFPPFVDDYNRTPSNLGFVNVYRHFTAQHIWPRGFPLNLINSKDTCFTDDSTVGRVSVGVWQGLADGDPDVDAIYRLVLNHSCYFDDKEPLVLSSGTICPFNSQNTAFIQELFPLLYLPTFVSFRYTDILRGFIAQPIMWQFGFSLGFTKATVIQERNYHDYMEDFASEVPCYFNAHDIIDTVVGRTNSAFSISENLYEAYHGLHTKGLVDAKEMELLSLWLKDIDRLSRGC